MVIRGDARRLPLADAAVDLIVTSPPYWALRSYTDGGQHYAGQIGAEPTPGEYVDNLIACTREWMRVLKPSGSIWINLGDKYASGPSGPRETLHSAHIEQWRVRRRGHRADVPTKSLIGLPWRYALRCIDELGLILRAEVIWSKPNGLPESVTDRVRRSHEQWFHMVRSLRYFSAVDEIRETYDRFRPGGVGNGSARIAGARLSTNVDYGGDRPSQNALGKLPGSVWTIPTEPLSVPDHLGVDHFAAFPIEWPRRIILGWSPSGICTVCGEGRRPVTVNDPIPGWVRGTPATRQLGTPNPRPGPSELTGARVNIASRVTITGYVCACPDTSAPTRPGVVLDPFGGTGTTALAARALGRVGVSVDMSADYCRLAQWRTSDRGELARAMRVEKPEPVVEAQLALDLAGVA